MASVNIRSVIAEIRDKKLKLLPVDKTGDFVVIYEEMYKRKVEASVEKNLTVIKSRPPGSLRSKLKELCI